ncbi:MAG: hypothetical protein JWM68_2647 [Verrucomicrobiales bacterium]|nr:hypothetical protein [Verrucomicrobiales bacterium]
MKTILLQDDGRYAIWRIRSDEKQKLFRLLFRRYPEREWGAFFRFGFRRTSWGFLITQVDILPPVAGDLDRQSPIVEFRPAYIQRALSSLDAHPLGIGVVHSHPEGGGVSPSMTDDDMDSYFSEEFERFSDGRPYASFILAKNESGELSFSGRVFDKGLWFELKTMLTVGDSLVREDSVRNFYQSPPSGEDIPNGGALERVTQLLGQKAPKQLRKAIVGVVGASGTGTPALNVLARANMGEVVLVDPGRVKDSNHQRNLAMKDSDLSVEPKPYKAALARRMIHEINPRIIVRSFAGDVLDDIVLDELVRCDLILGCSDANYARAALGDIAVQYLVPVIDLAVQMRAEDSVLNEQLSEIAYFTPGSPCPWCCNRVTATAIRYETSTETEREFMARAAADAERSGVDGAQYWGGTPPPELTVGYLTMMLGAMGAGYAQNLILGAAKIPHRRFQFDVGIRSFGMVEDNRRPNLECACQKFIGWSDQAKADRSVSKPQNWAKPLELH